VAEYRIGMHRDAPGRSPYRLRNAAGLEVPEVNDFLDALALRGLSERTQRTYAYALLSAWRWIQGTSQALAALTECHLAEYIRHLRSAPQAAMRPPAPRSINLRLAVLRSLYRFHTGVDLPRGGKAPLEPVPLFIQASRLGARARRRIGRPLLRVKVSRRLVVPLCRKEVVELFGSFRTYRDLSIAALMLLCGLRSREVLALRLPDVDLLSDEIRVSGKGERDRVLPLAPYTRRALSSYLRLERPETRHDVLFVNLKGRRRGTPMTPAGLYMLFLYHRRRSGSVRANPHRLRHTFATDMIREGMSLPVLKRLLGHSNIEMTLRYVNLSADDVRAEFERALHRLSENAADGLSLPRHP
jgi:site-specific recombinase XerD